jgi:hypothetical protein
MRSEWDNHDRSFCYKTNPAPLWIIAQLLPQILSKSLFVTLLSFLSWPETQRKVVENPEKKKKYSLFLSFAVSDFTEKDGKLKKICTFFLHGSL